MLFSRKYVLLVACLFLLIAHVSSFSFVSCSTSTSTDEYASTDGGNTDHIDTTVRPDTVENADGNDGVPTPPDIIVPPEEGRPDKYCYPKSEPHRKRTGSWALGPASLAPNSYESQVVAMATDSQGNVILLVQASSDVILMKIGPDSVPLWTFRLPSLPYPYPEPYPYPDASPARFKFIHVDAQDNIYIATITSGELKFGSSTILVPQKKTYYVLFKFSSQGQPLSLRYIPEYLMFTTFSLSPQGELYVAGYAREGNISVPTVSHKYARIVVAKYGTDGSLLWIRGLYTGISLIEDCTLSRMVVDSQENIYLTGSFDDDLQFGAQNSLTLTAPSPPKDRLADSNLFVTKLDKHGSFQWASYAGTHTASNTPLYASTHSDIIVDKVGNVYITGSWQSTRTFGSLSLPWVAPIFTFVAKLTPAGIFAWAIPGPNNKDERNKGTYSSFAHKLHLMSDGSLVLTGNSSCCGYLNIFSAYFDTTGKWLSIVRLGYGSNPLYSPPPFLDNQGNLFVAGSFYGYSAEIGGFKLNNIRCPPGDGSSAFLWRLEKP